MKAFSIALKVLGTVILAISITHVLIGPPANPVANRQNDGGNVPGRGRRSRALHSDDWASTLVLPGIAGRRVHCARGDPHLGKPVVWYKQAPPTCITDRWSAPAAFQPRALAAER